MSDILWITMNQHSGFAALPSTMPAAIARYPVGQESPLNGKKATPSGRLSLCEPAGPLSFEC